MSQCQSCTGPTDLYLCQLCTQELKAQLTSLASGPYIPAVKGRTASGGNWHIERRSPGLLDALTDVVLKRTRLGGSGGHRKRGDERPDPFEPDTDKGKQTAQGRADVLLMAARNHLSTIIRDMCESRGGQPRLNGGEPAEMAEWLASNVHAIACDESAGQWRAEVDALVRAIVKAIDRPTKIELLGFCGTDLPTGPCGTQLRAIEDAIEVRCPKCRTVRRCDIVRRIAQSEARRELIPWSKVLEVNKKQPEGWRVNERTLRHWRSSGALKPFYLRPGGRHAMHKLSDQDVPHYKWDDIEQLRSKAPRVGRKRTRAGA